jgi:hypothetical protein
MAAFAAMTVLLVLGGSTPALGLFERPHSSPVTVALTPKAYFACVGTI